jgi:hypothetical protein
VERVVGSGCGGYGGAVKMRGCGSWMSGQNRSMSRSLLSRYMMWLLLMTNRDGLTRLMLMSIMGKG